MLGLQFDVYLWEVSSWNDVYWGLNQPGRKGRGKTAGDGKREGRKWDSQGGENLKKQEKMFKTLHNILQHVGATLRKG